MTKLLARHEQDLIEAYAQSLRGTVTSTFNLVISFLVATHRLNIMIIICAKLFLNPTLHNKVMGRTRTCFTEVYAQSLRADFDLNL